MPFWNRKTREDRVLSHDIIRQQRDTRSARGPVSGVSNKVAMVIALLQDQPDWDYAMTEGSAHQAAIHAAAFIGFEAPFDTEETAILDYLTAHFAGRKIATFAWGLYADQLRAAE